jgi:chromosome segregation ATPase
MSSLDLRGFNYAFEPLLSRRRWELEALQARLGRQTGLVQAAQQALDELRAQHEACAEDAGQQFARRPDAASHGQSLRWLARLRAQIGQASEELAGLRTERTELLRQCRVHQQQVDAIEAHRNECGIEFGRDEAGRQSKVADGDWLARVAARAASHQFMGDSQ